MEGMEMSDDKTHVQVYINELERKPGGRSKFDGYEDGDPLRLAVAFETFQVANVQRLLDAVFDTLNQDTPQPLGTLTREAILSYHRLNPSLSVGDVMVVDGIAWAVEGFGFKPVRTPKGIRAPLPFEPERAAMLIADCSRNWVGPAIPAVHVQKLAFLLSRDASLRHAWDDVLASEQKRLATDLGAKA